MTINGGRHMSGTVTGLVGHIYYETEISDTDKRIKSITQSGIVHLQRDP
jgi:ACT domain-containing protein